MSYIIISVVVTLLGYIISQNKGEKPKGLLKLEKLSNAASDSPSWHLILVVLGMFLSFPYNLVIYAVYFIAFILDYVGFVLNWIYTNIVLPVINVAYKVLCMITDIALMVLRIIIRYFITIPIDVFLSVINSVPSVLKWSNYRGHRKVMLYGFIGYAILEFVGYLFNQPLIGMIGGPLALVIAVTWVVGKVSFGNNINGKKAAIFAVSVIGVILVVAGVIFGFNQSAPLYGWGGVFAGIWYSPSVLGIMTIIVLLFTVAFITNVGAIYINTEGDNTKLSDSIKGVITASFNRSWYFILQPLFVLLIGGILTFLPYSLMTFSADTLGERVVSPAMSSTGESLLSELMESPSKVSEAMGDEVTDKQFNAYLDALNTEMVLNRKIADNATFSSYINSTLPLMEIPSPVMSDESIKNGVDAAKKNKEGLESAHKDAMKQASEQLKSMSSNGATNEDIKMMKQRKDRADKWMKAQIGGAKDMLNYRESCATKYSLTYLAFLLGKAILFGVLSALIINLYAYSVRPVYNMHKESYLVAQVTELKAKDQMQPWIGIVLIAMIAFGAMSSGRIINKISSLIPSMGQASVEGSIDATATIGANIDEVNNLAADVVDVFGDSVMEVEEEVEDELIEGGMSGDGLIFYCNDGGRIPIRYRNDGDCDCPDCEDER